MATDMETIKLAAQPRTQLGSRRVRQLRHTEWMPGVVYNSEGRSQPIQVNRHNLELLVRRHGGQNLILDLEIAGDKARKVLLKELQRDRIRDQALHADFMEISLTRKIRVPVAIRLVGEPVGVSQQGGVLEHLLRNLEVECLPADIIKEVTLDVSGLSIGDSRAVRDLKVDPKLTVLTPGEVTVASVQMPHIEEEVKPEEAAAEAAEPAVIGEEEKAAAEAEGAEKGKERAPAKGAKEAPAAKAGKEAPAKGGKEAPAAKAAAPERAGKEAPKGKPKGKEKS